MKSYTVAFKPEAEDHLEGLFDYIADVSSSVIARRYLDAIVAYCVNLADFPYRGTARDDVISGLRTISYRSRALIVFSVEADRVVIMGVFYGGQNWEATLAV